MLSLIDIPNIDRTLADVLGHKPDRDTRPDWGLIYRWLEVQADGPLEVCAFANVADPPYSAQARWLHYLRVQGYRVFAKPRTGESDIDQDMLDHLTRRRDEGSLRKVVVFS